NDTNSYEEYDGIRVDKDDKVEEIRENSNVMNREVIKRDEKVDYECVDVSDSMMKNVAKEIRKLSKEKNKDAKNKMELKQNSKSANLIRGCRNDVAFNSNVSSMENTFADKVDAKNVSNFNKLSNNPLTRVDTMKSYTKTAMKIKFDKNLFRIPTSIKDNGDEVVIFDKEIVEEGSKK
nr:hypothetical protein [Tanacetum cinerariifolium]